MRAVNINKADIVISGYVERFNGKMYSSCLIMDQGRTYNLRKKYPYNDESKYISSWAKDSYQIIPLSIGRSYFFICNDISVELEDDEVLKYINEGAVENFFLISAMGVNFDKHIEKLKNRAIQFGGKNVIYCDRFNGAGALKIQ